MSDEIKPDDGEPTRRYTLWRDLSANARFPSEDFVARAALHSRPQRNPAEGLNQFRSEYPIRETAEETAAPSSPVELPPVPPERPSVLNGKTVGAVAALFVVGFAVAVGLKQWQNPPVTVVAQAPSNESRPIDAPSNNPVETLASEPPLDVASDSSATPSAAAGSAEVATKPPASPVTAPVERTPVADSRATSTSADALTTSQPERQSAALSANARPAVVSTPPFTPASAPAPDPVPVSVTREAPVNATATGAVDVPVPAAARNTPVATSGGDVPSVAGAPSATEADLRPAPLDRPVPALSTAAPAPIATPTVTPAAAIQRTLQGYQSAFSRLDVNAVRQVWPSVDQKALAKAFDQLKSEDLTLENCKVTVTGANAVAACGGKTEYVPKIGSKNARVERHQWRISLQQVADRWVVHQVDVTAP